MIQAGDLVEALQALGEEKRLIGMKVKTEAYGDYPGGIATIMELHPDPEAPEIVFNVQHPTWRGDENDLSDGVIGIFDHEGVELCKEGKQSAPSLERVKGVAV
jgi:hypothetical protein